MTRPAWAQPLCPGCDSEPVLPPEILLPCICPNDDCRVFSWNPSTPALEQEWTVVDTDALTEPIDRPPPA